MHTRGLLHVGIAPNTTQQFTGHKNVQSVKTMQSLQVKCRKNLSDILTNKEIIPNKELEIPALIVFLKCQYTISI